nr:hypothetical protein Iba_chr03cCG2830 [Ipomoea batatas]
MRSSVVATARSPAATQGRHRHHPLLLLACREERWELRLLLPLERGCRTEEGVPPTCSAICEARRQHRRGLFRQCRIRALPCVSENKTGKKSTTASVYEGVRLHELAPKVHRGRRRGFIAKVHTRRRRDCRRGVLSARSLQEFFVDRCCVEREDEGQREALPELKIVAARFLLCYYGRRWVRNERE